jgi:hypothetical protein
MSGVTRGHYAGVTGVTAEASSRGDWEMGRGRKEEMVKEEGSMVIGKCVLAGD